MKTATFIRDIKGWLGHASLYKLSEPMGEGIDYVIVSEVVAPFSGSETYIFHADVNGDVIDWSELDGSFRGSMSHEKALKNAGYEIA